MVGVGGEGAPVFSFLLFVALESAGGTPTLASLGNHITSSDTRAANCEMMMSARDNGFSSAIVGSETWRIFSVAVASFLFT